MSTRVLVTQQGAQGDGQADDAPAILRAVRLACERGSTLVFPPGIYRIGQTIALPTGGAHRLEGDGAVLLPHAGFAGPALSAEDDTPGRLTLSGLTLEGFTTGLWLRGSQEARVWGLRLQSCSVGALFEGGDGIELTHSVFADNGVDVSLGTGSLGLARVHLSRNRMSGTTPIRFTRDSSTAGVTGLVIGPGDRIGGALAIPSWASRTTVLFCTVGSLSDAGVATTTLGVPGVQDRLNGGLSLRGGVGFGATVAFGAKSLSVTFPTAEADDGYFLSITPNWNTTWSTVAKRSEGFDVRFGTTAPAGARIDWHLVR